MQAELDCWFSQHQQRLARFAPVEAFGRITGISGILLESSLPGARIGDLCRIEGKNNTRVLAEVVGFNPQHTLLSALGQLDGIAQGARVTPLYQPHSIRVSDALLGSVLDGFGRPIEEGSLSAFAQPGDTDGVKTVLGDAPPPTERPRIDTPLPTGMRAIDGLLTLGVGQRVGIFAGAGCGKTTLLAELARNTPCDVIVFGLIGERGRELREFLDHELDSELRSRTVLLCATSDRSSMERARAAFTATAIAEAFREIGEKRAADPRLADPFCPRAARNWPGARRAAGAGRAAAFGLHPAAYAAGESRADFNRRHHRALFRADRAGLDERSGGGRGAIAD